jgi:glutathione peroxidase
MAANIYEFTTKSLEGQDVALSAYSGKVMLIVNTASQCGFTPQYAELETLHEKYSPNGLVVIGFPCNQFGGQEPGNSDEIKTFCERNYGVSFPMMHKIDVNGEHTDPIYQYLKDAAPGVLGSEAIKWNFTKFLIGKDGKVVKRYAPTVKPLDITGDIESELAK